MLFQHGVCIAQRLMPIYNSTVHENMLNIALNLTKNIGTMDTNMLQGGTAFVFKEGAEKDRSKIW